MKRFGNFFTSPATFLCTVFHHRDLVHPHTTENRRTSFVPIIVGAAIEQKKKNPHNFL